METVLLINAPVLSMLKDEEPVHMSEYLNEEKDNIAAFPIHESEELPLDHHFPEPENLSYVIPPNTTLPSMWVVVFTDLDVCLRFTSTFHNWTVLIVGKVEPPAPQLRHSRCVYFTPDFHKFQESLLTTHLSMKLASLYYAIKRGAERFYVTDDKDPTGSNVIPDLVRNDSKQTSDLTVFATERVILDSLLHWGCNQLDVMTQMSHSLSYKLCSVGREAAIQIAATQVFTGFQKISHIDSLESCDVHIPSVMLSTNVTTLILPQDALFLRSAFWALPLVEAETQEELFALSVMTQELLRSNGDHVEVRLGQSIPFVHLASSLVMNLTKQELEIEYSDENFMDIVDKRVQMLTKFNLISHKTSSSYVTWLHLLKGMHFELGMVNKDEECPGQKDVQYYPINYNTSYNPTITPANNMKHIKTLFHKTCCDYEKNFGASVNFEAPWVQYEDILLLIVFNNAIFDSIHIIETLYRPFFPLMLYCGPEELPEKLTGHPLRNFQVSYVAYQANIAKHRPGFLNYECVSLAHQMNYRVQGYFILADDILLIPGKLQPLMKNKVWTNTKLRVADVVEHKGCPLDTGVCDMPPGWVWWGRYWDQSASVMKELELKRTKSRLIDRCLTGLRNLTGGTNRMYSGYSDTFYLPQRLIPDFSELTKIFRENLVWLEIAIPTIIRCLNDGDEHLPLPGFLVWGNHREEILMYFMKLVKDSKYFLHPLKWSFLTSESKDDFKKLFCSATYLLHDKYSGRNDSTNFYI